MYLVSGLVAELVILPCKKAGLSPVIRKVSVYFLSFGANTIYSFVERFEAAKTVTFSLSRHAALPTVIHFIPPDAFDPRSLRAAVFHVS